jgi:hypothetical protein
MPIYLKSEDLLSHYTVSKEKNECTLSLIKDFQIIAEHVFPMVCNFNDENKEIYISYAVEEAWQKWNKFDPERGNIFAFYTSMITNDIRLCMINYCKFTKRTISLSLFNSDNKPKDI